jgi:hypothetical protein
MISSSLLWANIFNLRSARPSSWKVQEMDDRESMLRRNRGSATAINIDRDGECFAEESTAPRGLAAQAWAIFAQTAAHSFADRSNESASIRLDLIEKESSSRTDPLEIAAVGFLLLMVVVGLQYVAGAYGAEFTDDDASHYISGLLIYNFLRAGQLQSPVQYLQIFHSHYPLVGIGHWGPLYYFVEAIWMLVFSSNRVSVLLLSAVVTAATALSCYVFLARRLGRPGAAFVALALILCPIVQESSRKLMLDMPVTFLCLLSMFSYVRYLNTGYARHAVIFGVLAGAGMMVKGNAACLALLPLFAILIGRRFDLLRQPSFWSPALIVLLITGPWYLLTYGLVSQGFRFSWGVNYVLTASASNSQILLTAVGPVVLIFAVIGFFAVVAAPSDHKSSDSWLVCTAALLGAVLTFQTLVPAAIEDRYLAPALPPLLILAVWGWRSAGIWIIERIPAWRSQFRLSQSIGLAGILVLAISFLPQALETQKSPQRGLIEAASAVWANLRRENPSVLVATDPPGEGASIVELAMADPNRPSLFAVRGSRLLGGGGYNDGDYLPRFETPAEVMAAIDDYAIPLVLVSARNDNKQWTHLRQIAQAQQLYPDRWELIYRDTRASPEVLLFRIRGNDNRNADFARLTALSGPRALTR